MHLMQWAMSNGFFCLLLCKYYMAFVAPAWNYLVSVQAGQTSQQQAMACFLTVGQYVVDDNWAVGVSFAAKPLILFVRRGEMCLRLRPPVLVAVSHGHDQNKGISRNGYTTTKKGITRAAVSDLGEGVLPSASKAHRLVVFRDL